jgi:hypothetical protein
MTRPGLAPSLLTAAAAEGFDQDDFDRMIANGDVLMSGEAFMALQKKKLTESLNITGRMLAADAQCGEQFITSDPFNGTDAEAFLLSAADPCSACVFELKNPAARALGRAGPGICRRKVSDAPRSSGTSRESPPGVAACGAIQP